MPKKKGKKGKATLRGCAQKPTATPRHGPFSLQGPFPQLQASNRDLVAQPVPVGYLNDRRQSVSLSIGSFPINSIRPPFVLFFPLPSSLFN
jgi:hypothetical protein